MPLPATLDSIISQATEECEIGVSDKAATDNAEAVVADRAKRFVEVPQFGMCGSRIKHRRRAMKFRQLLSSLLAMGLSGNALSQSGSAISTSVHAEGLSHPVEI